MAGYETGELDARAEQSELASQMTRLTFAEQTEVLKHMLQRGESGRISKAEQLHKKAQEVGEAVSQTAAKQLIEEWSNLVHFQTPPLQSLYKPDYHNEEETAILISYIKPLLSKLQCLDLSNAPFKVALAALASLNTRWAALKLFIMPVKDMDVQHSFTAESFSTAKDQQMLPVVFGIWCIYRTFRSQSFVDSSYTTQP